ncbi:MAG: hypothetical protein AABY75_09785 [Bacteroidota bacterium]
MTFRQSFEKDPSEFRFGDVRVESSKPVGKKLPPENGQLECFPNALIGCHLAQRLNIPPVGRSGLRVHGSAAI